MEEEELAQELEGSEEIEVEESSEGSIRDDFDAIFGTGEGEDDADSDDDVTEEPLEEEPQQAAEEPKAPTQDGTAVVEDGITPPQRFKEKHKQIFSKIRSKELRRGIQEMVRDLEGGSTKKLQELQQEFVKAKTTLESNVQKEFRAIQHIRQATQPYEDALTLGGKIPITQGMDQIFQVHQRLSSDKPEVVIDTFKRLAHSVAGNLGTTPDQLLGVINNHKPNNSSNGQGTDPSQIALQNKIKELESRLTQVQYQPVREKMASEFDSVRLETDEAGRYKWPELHDGESRKSVNTLLSGVKQAHPNISYPDAIRKAVMAVRAMNGNLQPQTLNGLPANNQHKQHPSGGSSIRGRSAQTVGSLDLVKDAPKSGSIKDDWNYIMQNL